MTYRNFKICISIFLIFLFILICERLYRLKDYKLSSSLIYGQRKLSSLNMEDVVLCLRTSSKNWNRLAVLFKTWLPLTLKSVHIITDYGGIQSYSKEVKRQWIETKCKSTHERRDLCCKMESEITLFWNSDKKWFCHVDDDTYLNIPALMRLLNNYNNKENFYLGKTSIQDTKDISFQFATGGAGFCLSRSLVLAMSNYILNKKFVKICEQIHLPDDCAIGYIITNNLKVNLTNIQQFHSHLENLSLINVTSLPTEVSFSYNYETNKINIVSIDGFSSTEDPTRFFSIHCHLFPFSKECLHLKSFMEWNIR